MFDLESKKVQWSLNIIDALEIFFNSFQVQCDSGFVYGNNNSIIDFTDKVGWSVWFYFLQTPIDISNMLMSWIDKSLSVGFSY